MIRRLTVLALMLATLCVPCLAEDEDEGADAEPSPIAELREERLLEDTDPADPLEYLGSFRDWVRQHETPPPHTAKDRTLYNVWNSALKPRARRMTRRLDTLMKRKYWQPERGAARYVGQKYWQRFINEIAGLNSELIGAARQYNDVKLRERQVGRVRPRYYGYAGYGYPVGRWRRAVLYRQGVGGYYGTGEMNSYWNLMNHYRAGWGWRTRTCVQCEIKRRELQKTLNEDVAEKRRLLETTRDTLQQQALSLQLLAGAMQAAEENRLHTEMEKLPEDHLLREPAEDLLVALRDARLAAERYSGDSSARYGGLLRSWLRAYKAGSALLDKEAAKLESAEDEDDAEDDAEHDDGDDR